MYAWPDRHALAGELADAFLEGRWIPEALAERGSGRLNRWPAWMTALAFAAVAQERAAPVDRRSELEQFIERFLRDWPTGTSEDEPPLIIRHLRPPTPVHVHEWPVAQIPSVAALAQRLELSDGQLAWLADARGWERTVQRERLRNYRYRWLPRHTGLPRLVEAPKARLKEVQRWVLHEILDRVPAHDAAHGFARGRSVLTHASVHTNRRAVLRLDLRDFFASVAARRVHGLFQALGYEPRLARVLTGLCTNTVPAAVWSASQPPAQPRLVQAHFWLGRQLATPHLPQGAPTSPALANLAAFGLDRRLSALGRVWGLRYSRYADDLTFSGPRLNSGANRAVHDAARRIVSAEGFRLHEEKSTLRGAGQRQLVTGIVVNQRLNCPREEYDQLRAELHRLALDGPGAAEASVDLKAHLRGRVAWVAALNPGRGEKLRRRFDAIDWDRGLPQTRS